MLDVVLFVQDDVLAHKLRRLLDGMGAKVARYLGLPADWFDAKIDEGNSILRLLHYPPIAGATGEAIRAGTYQGVRLGLA